MAAMNPLADEVAQYPRQCPLCAARREDSVETPYSRPPWRIVRCNTCNFVYQDAAPKEELLREELAWEHTHAVETARRQMERPRVKETARRTRMFLRRIFGRRKAHVILRSFAAPGPVIDLGCGSGEQIRKIGGGGFIPYGVEISAALARNAKSLLESHGGTVICDSAIGGLKTFSDEFFSGASLRSYLEHESRPCLVLKELHRTLKPNAVVLVKVPNFASINRKIFGRRWCGFRYPDHLNYFTPKTLVKMTDDCGYSVWKMWASPFSDNLWALFRKQEKR